MKVFETVKNIMFLVLVSFWLSSCVGPTTPFGSMSVSGVSKSNFWNLNIFRSPNEVPLKSNDKLAEIKFFPDAQVLHDKIDLSITIKDYSFIPKNYSFKIYHNSLDVTNLVKENSKFSISQDRVTLTIEYKDLRFKTGIKNDLFVQYFRGENLVATSFYEEPNCNISQHRSIASIPQFAPPSEYISWINSMSEEAKINPALINGIVAQESGFNPSAISFAKAIGLTQMTSLAEQEIIQNYQHWPRYKGINEMNFLVLKSLVAMGQINPNTEWRLNPKLNIKGGLTYLVFLKEYWEKPQNNEVIKSLTGDYSNNLSRVIIASYNSGAARVKAAIQEKGNFWESHEKLKEASKYVQKVSSYCYHYSRRG